MSANTILLDFTVDPGNLTGDGPSRIESEVIAGLVKELETLGEVSGLEKVVGKELSPLGDFLFLYSGPRGSTVMVRTYPSGLVTVNIDYYLEEGGKPILTLEGSRVLEERWTASFGQGRGKGVKTLPRIRRGLPFDVYFLSSDERLMEYDIDKVVFDEKSPFQHVQILHSLSFGNMLVLDDLQNLAESDLIYTESIMCRGSENYKGKEILILGGGDGALLYELRKESPKHVTMIEIDDLVMQVCKIHLRSACGDVLDSYKGDDYEIIVGDCIPFMQNCRKEGKKFDYVFADLTDIPISPTPQGELWDFIRLILNLSFSVLGKGGKYMTHGNGSSSPAALKMFEDQLERLDEQVEFKRTNAFVPSFMEDWVFYQIWRKGN